VCACLLNEERLQVSEPDTEALAAAQCGTVLVTFSVRNTEFSDTHNVCHTQLLITCTVDCC
jgi:hypothetical protein